MQKWYLTDWLRISPLPPKSWELIYSEPDESTPQEIQFSIYFLSMPTFPNWFPFEVFLVNFAYTTGATYRRWRENKRKETTGRERERDRWQRMK
jgi:hypothetical protein